MEAFPFEQRNCLGGSGQVYWTTATSMDLRRLSAEFERIAATSSEDGMARLQVPGVQGLQILFAGCVREDTIGVEELRNVYKATGWSENRLLVWSEVKSVVEMYAKNSPHSDDDIDDFHGDEFGGVCEVISNRQATNEFPLVKPSDLKSEEDQKGAAMLLALLDDSLPLIIRSYLAK